MSLPHVLSAVKSNATIDDALARCAVAGGRASWRPEHPPYSYALVEPDRYEPSAEDLEDYGAWSREVDERLWAARIEADEPEPAAVGFACWIAVQAHEYRERGTERAVWLADRLAALADRARYLDAGGPASFDDRDDAARDARSA